MRRALTTACLVILSLSIGFAQRGKVTFKATSDASRVVLGDYFTVKFIVDNGEPSAFKPPDFAGFLVLDNASGSSMSIINGVVSKSNTYSYTLQPKKAGKYYIRPATVTVNRKTYRSKSIPIEVLKANNKGKGDDVMTRMENGTGVFIRAELDDSTHAFLGQQIAVNFRLYTSVGLNHYNIIQEPTFPGFYARNIQRFDNQVVGEIVNNIAYKTKVLKRVVLFPQKTGKLEVPAIQVRIGFPLNNGRRTFRKIINSEALQLQVKSLPTVGKPANFTGAIGNYDMVIKIGETTATTDDAIPLRMQILGEGDIKQIQAPQLDLPKDAFEVYDPTVSEDFYEQNGLIAGKKTFEYMILPKKPGLYEFTPSFSFFRGDTAKYVTLETQTYNLNVGMGNNPLASGRMRKSMMGNNEKEIHALMTEGNLKPVGHSFLGSGLFWILFTLPFLLLLGAIGYRRKQVLAGNIDMASLKQQRANKEAKKRLSKAQVHLKEKRHKEFYKEISDAIWGYISDKLGLPTSELSRENIREKLATKAVDNTHIDELLALFNTCDMALFASIENEQERASTYDKAIKVIMDIEEQLS